MQVMMATTTVKMLMTTRLPSSNKASPLRCQVPLRCRATMKPSSTTTSGTQPCHDDAVCHTHHMCSDAGAM